MMISRDQSVLDHEWVIVRSCSRSPWRGLLAKGCAVAGVRYIKPHGTRRTCASLLVALDVHSVPRHCQGDNRQRAPLAIDGTPTTAWLATEVVTSRPSAVPAGTGRG